MYAIERYPFPIRCSATIPPARRCERPTANSTTRPSVSIISATGIEVSRSIVRAAAVWRRPATAMPLGRHEIMSRTRPSSMRGSYPGNSEDRLQGRALQAARHPRQHLRKDLVRHRRDEHPHEVRPLPCERAGDTIRHVADRRGRAQHPLPGRGSRIARVAQHPRDGHLADPGAPGDVAQRAGAHRPGTASVSKSGRGSVRGGSSGNAVDMGPGPDDIRNHSMFALTHPGSTGIVATAVVT